MVGPELAAVLLHLNNVYDLTGFEAHQSDGLLALGEGIPEAMAGYYTGQFYTPHVSMRARFLILDVIQRTAQALSAVTPTELPPPVPTDPAGTGLVPTPMGVSADGKTRRWSCASAVQEAPSRPNGFGGVAGLFFYPLMVSYDTNEGTLDLLGEDSMVLGRLLCTLGCLVEAAQNTTAQPGMARTLLEFLLAFRGHSHAYVRQCGMFALSRAIVATTSLTAGTAGVLGDVLAELGAWLEGIMRQDPSPVNRECAAHCAKMVEAVYARPVRLF